MKLLKVKHYGTGNLYINVDELTSISTFHDSDKDIRISLSDGKTFTLGMTVEEFINQLSVLEADYLIGKMLK